jgi:hypothetical protein
MQCPSSSFSRSFTVSIALLLCLVCLRGMAGDAVNTAPVQPFFGAKFEPPAGRALHGWGQISHGWNTDHPGAAGDMQDYVDYLGAVGDYPPAVVSLYIHPQREDGQAQLDGFIERYAAFAREDSWQMAQIAYDFDPQHTLSGKGDKQLEQFFKAVASVGKPVFLRIGWEFNNRGHFDPEGYREGYRYIVDKMRAMGVSNVATLWHASVPDLNELAGMPILSEHPYMDFYPGDDYVDWWSISEFAIEHFRSPGSIEFYENAASRRKPVFIGESAPWMGGESIMTFRDPVTLQESLDWFSAYFSLFEDYPQIKGMNVIIIDWQRWNWIWPNIKGGFNNTRLDLFPELAGHYRQRLSSPRFIHAQEARRMYTSN